MIYNAFVDGKSDYKAIARSGHKDERLGFTVSLVKDVIATYIHQYNEGQDLKARLHYKTELNSTVVADKEQWPKTIQSLGSGLEYTKTAVLDPATL